MSTVEVAVIGAGPAGCAAAIRLARAGRQVLLLERSARAQESVCGEFLGVDAAAALAQLGLDLPALGALPLHGLRFGAGTREAAAALPFAAWALPRRILDGALRDAARAAGAALRMNTLVLGAETEVGHWRLRLAEEELRATRLVLATGKHALRGHPRLGAPPGALGLKLHLAGVTLPAEVVLLPFAGGYAGLQPLPGGGANLCVALHGAPGAAARRASALLERVATGSALAARLLSEARPAWGRPLAVAGVPYGFRHRTPDGPQAAYRVGDQAAVIPSFTGEGVAMALTSGIAAAEAILAGEQAARFHAAWRQRIAGRMRWAALSGWLLERAPRLAAMAMATHPGLAHLVAERTRPGSSLPQWPQAVAGR
jgi:menaquinone-9 beta-reductase